MQSSIPNSKTLTPFELDGLALIVPRVDVPQAIRFWRSAVANDPTKHWLRDLLQAVRVDD